MSAAIRAKTAKGRALIAARAMRAGYTPGRAFDDCFEMGDGDEVVAHLRRMAQRNSSVGVALRANWSKYLCAPLAEPIPEDELHNQEYAP